MATKTAVKFLSRQYKELTEKPLLGVAAEPLNEGEDLFHWHGNFFFPHDHPVYAGLCLHFKMDFDSDYPVVDEDKEVHVGISDGVTARQQAEGFACKSCQHTYAKPNPAPQVEEASLQAPGNTSVVPESIPVLSANEYLQRHRLSVIFEELKLQLCQSQPDSPYDFCSEYFKHLSEAPSEVPKAAAALSYDIQCSITGVSFTSPGVVMGIGVEVIPCTRGAAAFQITTDLHPLSYEAFTDGIRLSAGGNRFTHFLPLVINETHWQERACPLSLECIEKIAASAGLADNAEWRRGSDPHCKVCLLVMGELWKGMAVSLMSGHEHASEKALNGFFTIHHLMLALARETPEIQKYATQMVAAFLKDPSRRTKKVTPDLGRFLPMLLLSDYGWADALPNGLVPGRILVQELFTRNAAWILRAHPDLAE
eukprot:gene27178-33453_t